ncbi:MAG: hypothetical protein PHR28_00060 [candidate division Zixibacteria bacterium]|nr:hypothetical protein [candidate division Zixibacteria bacterium]
MISRFIRLTIAILILSLPVAAQEPGFPRVILAADSIQQPWDPNSPHIILPGQRTRITAPELVSHALLGKIYTIRPDTIVLVTDRFYPGAPDAWKISLKNIKEYQIPEGYKDNTITGAILGSCAGVVMSTAFALVDKDRTASNRAFPFPATITGGGIIGALAGAITKSERWRTVPNEQLKLGLPLPEEPIPLHAITIGERVRVFTPGFDKHGFVGSVSAISDSIITLSEEYAAGGKGKSREIQLDRITLYQISIGQRSHALEGALAGLWSGIFLGSIKSTVDENESTGAVVPFTVAGMVAGAFIGRSIETDVWKVIPVDRLRLK